MLCTFLPSAPISSKEVQPRKLPDAILDLLLPSLLFKKIKPFPIIFKWESVGLAVWFKGTTQLPVDQSRNTYVFEETMSRLRYRSWLSTFCSLFVVAEGRRWQRQGGFRMVVDGGLRAPWIHHSHAPCNLLLMLLPTSHILMDGLPIFSLDLQNKRGREWQVGDTSLPLFFSTIFPSSFLYPRSRKGKNGEATGYH